MPDTPAISAASEPLSADYHLIKQKIPTWLPAATERNRQAFRRADTGHVDWLATLSDAQRTRLKQFNEAGALSQHTVDDAMASLQSAEDFARPLLQQALKAQWHVELTVDSTFVHLRKPFELGALGIRVGDFSTLTLSLLQAALHNFEEAECEASAFDRSSRFRSGPQSLAAAIETPLSVPGFLTLCRRLDIGAQYQAYLKAFFQPDDKRLQEKVIRAQKDALQAAAYLALLKQDISASDYAVIGAVIADQRDIRDDGKPVWFSDLSIMGLRLHGCTAFVAVEKYQSAREVLLYIPHDPQHPLKKYESSQALEKALTGRLMAGATGAELTPYQQFFRHFLAYADQPTYFRRLTQDATNVAVDPFAVWRSPITRFVLPFVASLVSIWASPRELPPRPPAPREPIDNPNFYLRVLSKNELWDDNVDLWPDNFAKLRDKLIADARSHAVPTADVDARVRAEKIAALESVGLLALNLVSMLVPGLGEVMIAVMAAQLLYETFEGVVEWHEGDREAALAHLTDVAENLALLGVMAAGGAALSRALKTPAVLENLKPVTVAGGARKLWKADLTPYKVPVHLDPRAKASELGLHDYIDDTVLPLEGDHYRVNQDPATAQYRIQHPTRANAYAPLLEHNHEGGWQHEGEDPLTWDEPTLLRRLGQPADGLSPQRLEQARVASGVDSHALRAGHVDQAPVPLALAESCKRLRIEDELTRFVAQMKSPDPAVYGQAEVTLQMHLLRRRGLLPAAPLQVFDDAGQSLWRDPVPASTHRAVVLAEGGVQRGELLQEVLYTLKEDDPNLLQFPGRAEDSLAQRAGLLRDCLGEQADAFKDALAEERYQAQAGSAEPDAVRLSERYPGLPASMAEHLLASLDSEQRQALHSRGLVPDALREQASWWAQETRVARAYEGIFSDAPTRLDSQRLALRTLETLPGWRRGSRVELRQYSADGTLLDAVGAAEDAARKTLVLDESGQFQGPMPRTFYSAAWHLLSAEERLAMGLTDVTQLKALIQRSPLPREPLRAVLADYPIRKPAYDPSMRLLGGGPGLKQLLSRAGNVFRTPGARAQRLFPLLDDAGVAAFIEGLGDDVRGGLSRLEDEYAQLKQDLKRWVRANAPATTLTAFDRQGGFVGTLAREIKRCWRRETTALKIAPGTALELPALSADFSHVEDLELSTVRWSGDAQVFLGQFKHLNSLRILQCGLTALPESIGQLPGLTRLSLRGNRLSLTAHSVKQLNELRQLTNLDLSHNPLGLAPDFSGMAQLRYIDLSHSQLTQWPTGLGAQTHLERLDLTHNKLASIPLNHLEPAPEQRAAMARINRVTSLLHNPDLLPCGDALDRYWRNLQQHHPALVPNTHGDDFAVETPLIITTRRLFPEFSIKQAREHIWSLGEGAEAVLMAREEAFSALNDQLNAWAFSGGGARQRYARMGRVLENAGTRDDRYLAKARIISCWKRETAQKLAADGTPIGLELDLSGLRLPSLPDLEADFSHVGSLRLSGMQLSASPEGFLARYRGVRWLDLANNPLRELPPALGEMHGLTRLFLDNNQIRLTPETARVLSGRTTLRALWMDRNPLGQVPDFSRIPDIRSVHLSGTDIDHWPAGLGEQPHLDDIDLTDNQLTTLPDSIIAPSDSQMEQSIRMCSITRVTNNPLTESTLQQVRAHSARLQRDGMLAPGRPLRLIATALGLRSPAVARAVGTAFKRWTRGLAAEQVATRTEQWMLLREQPASEGFFNMLADMHTPAGGYEDLQRRVWEVIDSITEPNADSAALREEMFTWTGRATCSDRAALSFSNLETLQLVYRARAAAPQAAQGPALLKLARGLFRLDEVEKTALADIANRSNAIHSDPQLSAESRQVEVGRLEEVEISLAYRYGLKGEDQLALPGQPDQARFISLAGVSKADLAAARARILALNNSPEELQALLARDFWKDYITQKYRPQFEAQSKPYHEQLAGLFDQVDASRLPRAQYDVQARALQDQLGIAEATLIEHLTRGELLENPIPESPSTPK